jgi:hypothetical protein
MNTETVTVLPKGEDFEIIVQHDQSGSAYGMPLSKNAYEQLRQHFVSGSLTPFGESIKLLRDLADLQNGAPLEQHRQEWEETMEQVYDFLNKWEDQ